MLRSDGMVRAFFYFDQPKSINPKSINTIIIIMVNVIHGFWFIYDAEIAFLKASYTSDMKTIY